MELKKYKLADIAKIEISGVDKKTMDGEISVRLCNFVDVYYNWAITKEKAKSFMVASAKQTEIDISFSFWNYQHLFLELSVSAVGSISFWCLYYHTFLLKMPSH